MLAICFLGSDFFAQRFKRPFDKNCHKNFGCFFGQISGLEVWASANFWLKDSPSIADWSLNLANISPHRNKFPLTGTNFPSQKLKHILAKIGQNPIYAECESGAHARSDVLEGWFFSAYHQSKFHGGLQKKVIQDPTNCCRVIRVA